MGNINGTMDNVLDLSDWQNVRIGLAHLYTDQDFDIPIEDIPDNILVGSPVIENGTYTTEPIDIGGIVNVYTVISLNTSNEEGTYRTIEISYSDDDVTYSDWEYFNGGMYEARYFKFRITFVSSGNPNMIIDEFKVEFDAPIYSQSDSNISIDIGGTAITFPESFNIVPSITAIAIGDANPRLVSQSESGFTIKVVDDSGVDISGVINWTAIGY